LRTKWDIEKIRGEGKTIFRRNQRGGGMVWAIRGVSWCKEWIGRGREIRRGGRPEDGKSAPERGGEKGRKNISRESRRTGDRRGDHHERNREGGLDEERKL